MGKAGTPASQVNVSIQTVLERSVPDLSKFRWPSNQTLGRWRSALLHLVRIQIGWILTTACRAGDHLWTISQDGTPDNQRHVEAFVIQLQHGKIGGIPWVQGNKTGAESAFGCAAELGRCHAAYQDLYEAASRRGLDDGLPQPVDPRLFLCSIRCTVSDHTTNESKRVQELSKMRDALIDQLEQEGDNRFKRGLLDGGCVMHKQMLIAHAEQKSHQKVIVCAHTHTRRARALTLTLTITITITIHNPKPKPNP